MIKERDGFDLAMTQITRFGYFLKVTPSCISVLLIKGGLLPSLQSNTF
jgi:hypothetical protein